MTGGKGDVCCGSWMGRACPYNARGTGTRVPHVCAAATDKLVPTLLSNVCFPSDLECQVLLSESCPGLRRGHRGVQTQSPSWSLYAALSPIQGPCKCSQDLPSHTPSHPKWACTSKQPPLPRQVSCDRGGGWALEPAAGLSPCEQVSVTHPASCLPSTWLPVRPHLWSLFVAAGFGGAWESLQHVHRPWAISQLGECCPDAVVYRLQRDDGMCGVFLWASHV